MLVIKKGTRRNIFRSEMARNREGRGECFRLTAEGQPEKSAPSETVRVMARLEVKNPCNLFDNPTFSRKLAGEQNDLFFRFSFPNY